MPQEITGAPKTGQQGQQTVSVNIGSEDLLSPTMFGLKCDEKMEYFF